MAGNTFASWLEKSVDELIALILVVVFCVISLVLALSNRIDELERFVKAWAPVILPIIGFYFGRKTTSRTAQQ